MNDPVEHFDFMSRWMNCPRPTGRKGRVFVREEWWGRTLVTYVRHGRKTYRVMDSLGHPGRQPNPRTSLWQRLVMDAGRKTETKAKAVNGFVDPSGLVLG